MVAHDEDRCVAVYVLYDAVCCDALNVVAVAV